MLGNCFCCQRMFTLWICIFFTHQALQLWEFIYNITYQVCFGQVRSTHCTFFYSIAQIQPVSNHFYTLLHTHGFFINSTQFFLEYDSFQFFHVVFQTDFQVFIIEEFCVSQTCFQYFFITCLHQIQVLSIPITYCDEFGHDVMTFFHREITLMFFHWSDNQFFRHQHISRIEFTHQSCRIFYQIYYFF